MLDLRSYCATLSVIVNYAHGFNAHGYVKVRIEVSEQTHILCWQAVFDGTEWVCFLSDRDYVSPRDMTTIEERIKFHLSYE